MKNNKGFTLIELLGIVVILVAIFLLAFPSLLGTTKQDEEKLYTSMVDDLCLAGETYIYSHIDDYPELSEPNSKININISTLIKDGNVSKDKENPKTKKSLNFDELIFSVLEDNSLECQYNDELYLANYITNLYTPNSTVVNNGITYNIDTINGIIDDGLGGTVASGGNLRYYGANPNNYIDIGDRDENNNPILWRIIGVFETKYATDSLPCDTDSDSDGHFDNCASDKLVKIIRNDSIGDYAWDLTSDNTSSNNWSDSTLKTMLNGAYYNSTTTDYYEYVYNQDPTVITVDFTNTGLSSSVHSKIETALWNLGGAAGGYEIYSNEMYTYERGTKRIYEIFPTEWIGKVGLMYPSDYGYATDLTKCNQTLNNYESSTDSYACRTNDWLYNSALQWTLSIHSSYSRHVFYVLSPGGVGGYDNAYYFYGVRPVLYLKSDVSIVGEGTTDSGIKYKIVE